MRFRVRMLEIEDKRQAFEELNLTLADEAGVARMAEKVRFEALKVEGLKPAAGNILKQEMLAIGGDAAVARGVINCSVETTSSVIMGTRKQLRALVKRLKPQPFGLKKLGEEILDLLKIDECGFKIEVGDKVLDLSGKPAVMGILNVTPDSFSDGGDAYLLDKALEAAEKMVAEGADIIDIGGESSRPGAEEVSAEEELRRVIPVIEVLSKRIAVPISIDTYKASVAKSAMEAGASIVNDISGLRLDPEMAKTVAQTGAGLVVMHMRGVPRNMQSNTEYGDIVGEIYDMLAQSVAMALEAGVDRSKIMIDPGIGFGKSVEGNLILLRRIREFTSMGLPVLVGASRKSFIGKTLGIEEPKERLEGSLASAVLAVNGGAKIIRAHDVVETRRAVDLAWAVKSAGEE